MIVREEIRSRIVLAVDRINEVNLNILLLSFLTTKNVCRQRNLSPQVDTMMPWRFAWFPLVRNAPSPIICWRLRERRLYSVRKSFSIHLWSHSFISLMSTNTPFISQCSSQCCCLLSPACGAKSSVCGAQNQKMISSKNVKLHSAMFFFPHPETPQLEPQRSCVHTSPPRW